MLGSTMIPGIKGNFSDTILKDNLLFYFVNLCLSTSVLTSVAMMHSFLSSVITKTDWYIESLGEHIADILHSGFSLRQDREKRTLADY